MQIGALINDERGVWYDPWQKCVASSCCSAASVEAPQVDAAISSSAALGSKCWSLGTEAREAEPSDWMKSARSACGLVCVWPTSMGRGCAALSLPFVAGDHVVDQGVPGLRFVWEEVRYVFVCNFYYYFLTLASAIPRSRLSRLYRVAACWMPPRIPH